jgi:hypothetical protein
LTNKEFESQITHQPLLIKIISVMPLFDKGEKPEKAKASPVHQLEEIDGRGGRSHHQTLQSH